MSAKLKTTAHVVDVLGNVIGRDQPITLMEKAIDLVSQLDKEVFTSDEYVFFDPFCKAGEFLLSIAFLRCRQKLSKRKIFETSEIQKELFKLNNYYALAPDERHHRLSLRTFLGNSLSHDSNYNHIIRDGHYLSEINGTLDKEKFQMEFRSMLEYIKQSSGNRKIIAVGNPPYQESDGGAQASAKPVYNFFVESLIDCGFIHEFVLVIPARWFSAGKGLDSFRTRMMTSDNIKSIQYFEKAEEVFPTVQIKGGVCFLHWHSNHKGKPDFIFGETSQKIDINKFDIIPDDPQATPIVTKILDKFEKTGFVSDIAWAGKPFGLRTFYFKRNSGIKENSKNAIAVYSTGRVIKYIDRKTITKNSDKIDEYKVVAPRAYGKGMSRCTLPREQIFIIGKGEISTETYNVIGCFKTRTEAENFRKYLQSDIVRYLLGLRKLTQDIPKDRWNWVPLLDAKTEWTDEALVKLFGLTKTEYQHIKNKVQEWS